MSEAGELDGHKSVTTLQTKMRSVDFVLTPRGELNGFTDSSVLICFNPGCFHKIKLVILSSDLQPIVYLQKVSDGREKKNTHRKLYLLISKTMMSQYFLFGIISSSTEHYSFFPLLSPLHFPIGEGFPGTARGTMQSTRYPTLAHVSFRLLWMALARFRITAIKM